MWINSKAIKYQFIDSWCSLLLTDVMCTQSKRLIAYEKYVKATRASEVEMGKEARVYSTWMSKMFQEKKKRWKDV